MGLILPMRGGRNASGPLYSAKVVVFGSSLMARTFANATREAYLQGRFTAMGYNGLLVSEAVGGQSMSVGTTTWNNNALGNYGRETFGILGSRGNDVTQGRPYATDPDAGGSGGAILDSQFALDWQALYDAFITGLGGVEVGDITKRIYTTTPTVDRHAADVSGSLPYNTNIVDPLISAAGKTKLRGYKLTDDTPWLVVDEDGVHLKVDSEHVYPEWLLLETKRKYSRDKAAVAGKEILISVVAFSQVLTDNMVTGTGKNVNTLCALQTKMFDTSGVHIPHLASRLIDGATPKDQTPGPMSGTADADLDDDVFTGSYNYASATETQDRGGSVKVLIDGMVAGQTGTITVMGWKDATNGDRTGTLFINGVSAGILDGASNATSNQIADIAFTVTADGELEVRLDSIGFAYLNGMKISFAA